MRSRCQAEARCCAGERPAGARASAIPVSAASNRPASTSPATCSTARFAGSAACTHNRQDTIATHSARAIPRHRRATAAADIAAGCRSEEHTSELQSLMRISYAVFCLKKKKKQNPNNMNIDLDKYIQKYYIYNLYYQLQ